MPAVHITRNEHSPRQDVRPNKAFLMETMTAAMKRNQSPRSSEKLEGRLPCPAKSKILNSQVLSDNDRGCPYETTFVNKGRRFPMYSGGRPLFMHPVYRAKDTLEPAADRRISNEIASVYQNLLPTSSVARRKRDLMIKLERLLNEEWPTKEFTVHAFGSTENLLATKHSDLDICIETEWTGFQQHICQLSSFMVRCGMQNVVCRSQAKVPVVAIYDPELNISCDMNVNNTLALRNTRLVKTYMQMDERARQLTYAVKHWASVRRLNEAVCNTLTSYTWTLMVINFLQTRAPQPLLPSLQEWHHEPRPPIDGVDVSFADDLEKYDLLKSFSTLNEESVGSLLFGFFHHYAFIFDYEHDVASVRLGAIISRLEKGYPGDNMFCIEEPFTISRNLGNTADMGSYRGIHAELQKAHRLLSDGAPLSAVFEPYVPTRQSSPPLSRHDRNSRKANFVSKGRQNNLNASPGRQPSQHLQQLRALAQSQNQSIDTSRMNTSGIRCSWAPNNKDPFLNSELHVDDLQRSHWQYLSEQENALLTKTLSPYYLASPGDDRHTAISRAHTSLDHVAPVRRQPQPRPHIRSEIQRSRSCQKPERKPSAISASPVRSGAAKSWTSQNSWIEHRPSADTMYRDNFKDTLCRPTSQDLPWQSRQQSSEQLTADHRVDTLSQENLLAVDASFFHPDALDMTCSEAGGSQESCGLTLASSRSSPSSMYACESPAVPLSYSDACMAGLDLKLPPPMSQIPEPSYETISSHFRANTTTPVKQKDFSPVRATYASKVSSPVSCSSKSKTSPARYEPFPAVRHESACGQ